MDLDTTDWMPQLAKGPHPAGSYRMCMMNLISWEDNDTPITDFPRSVAPALARFMHSFNDGICHHRQPDPVLLCPACSMTVMDIGHQTVGTSDATDHQQWTWATRLLEQALALITEGLVPQECDFFLNAHGNPVMVTALPRARVVTLLEVAVRRRREAVFAPDDADTGGRAAGESAAAALVAARGYLTRDEWVRFAREAVALWHDLVGTATPTVPADTIRSAVHRMRAHTTELASQAAGTIINPFSTPTTHSVPINNMWLAVTLDAVSSWTPSTLT